MDKINYARHLGLSIDDGATAVEVDNVLSTYTKTFHTKIRGVRHSNDDGSERQRIIKRYKEGEPLFLVREPDNPVNPRAVKVVRATGEQLGYLSDDMVGNDQGIGWCVADHLDKGERYEVVLKNITGGGGFFSGRQIRGVNIELSYYPHSS